MKQSALADALFTSTQQRVLALLFGQPHRSFYVNEIMALADSGRGAVQRELKSLEQSGLVTVSRLGNQKHYQANRVSPLFTELCGIVRKTVGLTDTLRDALAPLEERLRLALVYGSTAAGSERAESDVDVMLVSDDLMLEAVLSALAPVEQVIGRSVNPTLYTSAEFETRLKDENAFLMRVLEEPYLLLVGSLDDT